MTTTSVDEEGKMSTGIKFKTAAKTFEFEFSDSDDPNEDKKTKFSEVKEWITQTLKGELEPKVGEEDEVGVFKSHSIEQLKITQELEIGKLKVPGHPIIIQVLR